MILLGLLVCVCLGFICICELVFVVYLNLMVCLLFDLIVFLCLRCLLFAVW